MFEAWQAALKPKLGPEKPGLGGSIAFQGGPSEGGEAFTQMSPSYMSVPHFSQVWSDLVFVLLWFRVYPYMAPWS